jgi:hypothetical protein
MNLELEHDCPGFKFQNSSLPDLSFSQQLFLVMHATFLVEEDINEEKQF